MTNAATDSAAAADTTGAASAAPVVALRGLSKSFGGARALDGVDLTILPGEVHGLLGENGSGKSTLIKIVAGYHKPDAGTMEINGRPVELPLGPGDFREYGLSFVHQDLGLIAELTVLENLRIVELARSASWRIRWNRERRRATEAMARYGVELDPDAVVGQLSATDRARLAIVRAMEGVRETGAGRGLLVLDEPTVFLPRESVDTLFRLVREVAAQGTGVLFVSHHLDEVQEITDRVTVLRDGRLHGTVETARASEAELVEMIIGRSLAELSSAPRETAARPVCARVRGVSGAQLDDVSFDVHEREVLGITGLLGSGFEDVPYLLFGASPATAGRLLLGDEVHDLTAMTPPRAIESGLALVPGDRQHAGSVGALSIGENLMLQVLDDFGPLRLRRGKLAERAAQLLDEFDVRPPQPGLAYGSLSGGNQQKVVLAKWLLAKPQMLLVDEPTQGVDVGAREQIFGILADALAKGMSVVCASSDYEQLALICHRVLVVGRGKVVRELIGDEITKERITEQVYNSAASADAAREQER